MISGRTALFGLLIGALIPGGAQWYANRFWAGLVFLGSALTLGVYAYPRFGWPILVFVPIVALLEQGLWWRDHRSPRRRR